jgi:hypothetical protein
MTIHLIVIFSVYCLIMSNMKLFILEINIENVWCKNNRIILVFYQMFSVVSTKRSNFIFRKKSFLLNAHHNEITFNQTLHFMVKRHVDEAFEISYVGGSFSQYSLYLLLRNVIEFWFWFSVPSKWKLQQTSDTVTTKNGYRLQSLFIN